MPTLLQNALIYIDGYRCRLLSRAARGKHWDAVHHKTPACESIIRRIDLLALHHPRLKTINLDVVSNAMAYVSHRKFYCRPNTMFKINDDIRRGIFPLGPNSYPNSKNCSESRDNAY